MRNLGIGLALLFSVVSAEARVECSYVKETYGHVVFGEYMGERRRTVIFVDGVATPVPYGRSHLEFLAELAETKCNFPSYYSCNVEPSIASTGTLIGYSLYINGHMGMFVSVYGEDSHYYNRPQEARSTLNYIRERLVKSGLCY